MSKPVQYKPGYYASCYVVARRAAFEKGWNLVVHGSLATDLDLVAIPWTEDACPECELVETLGAAFQCFRFKESGSFHDKPGMKPHGRIAYTMLMDSDFYVDLSVMPRIPKQHPTCEKVQVEEGALKTG